MSIVSWLFVDLLLVCDIKPPLVTQPIAGGAPLRDVPRQTLPKSVRQAKSSTQHVHGDLFEPLVLYDKYEAFNLSSISGSEAIGC
jgi:hypothetical protein